MIVDAVPTPAEIDHALGRLEMAARERGVAVGMSSRCRSHRAYRQMGNGGGRPRPPAGANHRDRDEAKQS
jgi:hypothetical protein